MSSKSSARIERAANGVGDTPENPRPRTSMGLITDRDGASVKKGDSRMLTFKIVAVVFIICVTAMVVVISAVLLTRDSAYALPAEISVDTIPAPDTTEFFPRISDNDVESVTLRFVERPDWAARPSIKPLVKLNHPVPYVIISNTATYSCNTQESCTFRVQFNQAIDTESENLSDIRYNFLIGGDNLTYVGRDWDYVGAHSYGYNFKSIGISLIGTFDDVLPPKHQLVVVKKLIEHGVKEGKILPNYKLLGHRQLSNSRNPGDALYAVIKTWPHWSPTI